MHVLRTGTGGALLLAVARAHAVPYKAALLVRIAIKHRVSPLNDRLTAAEKRRSGRRRDGWN